MVAKLVCLGSLALLIATATFAAADAPAWCGVDQLNVVRNLNDCITSEPRTQGATGVSTDLPQVVAVPGPAIAQPVGVIVEPSLGTVQAPAVVAVPTFAVADPAALLAQPAAPQLPFALGQLIPMDGQQFTCVVGEPVPEQFCVVLYAVTAMLPFGGFR